SPLPSLWFLTDEARTPDPLGVARHLPSGTGVVLRHYRAPNRNALALGLAAIACERNLTLLIGADPALAAEIKAHGVHFPRWSLRRRAGPLPFGIVTASAHSTIEANWAQAIGVTAIFAGPVFATQSHESAQGLGPVRFSALTRALGLPVIALGGLKTANASRLLGSGAIGLGAIGALIPSTDNL
ncbi:MAG: thiamine phosphate synthase, partial [Alphaproteobacteria bacterium]